MADLGTFEWDLSIVAGVDWEFNFWLLDDNGNAIDLTGYSAQMDIRKAEEQPAAKHFASGTEITITAADGKVSVALGYDETDLGIREGVWDIILDDGTKRYRVGKGNVSVAPIVTEWV